MLPALSAPSDFHLEANLEELGSSALQVLPLVSHQATHLDCWSPRQAGPASPSCLPSLRPRTWNSQASPSHLCVHPAMLVANISAPEFGHCRACYFDDQFFSLVELNYKICAKRSSQGSELPHHPGHMGNLEAPQCLCVRGCSSKCSVAPPDCVQRVCSLVHGRSIQTQGAPR